MPGPRDWADWMQVGTATLSPFLSLAGFGVALWVAIRARRAQHREQASKITAWLAGAEVISKNDEYGREHWAVVINNASDQVVYDLLAQIVQVSEDGMRSPSSIGNAKEYGERVGNVPPGARTIFLRYPGVRGMHKRAGIELAFQDAAGTSWFRAAQGTLTDIGMHPADFYKLDKPVVWGVKFHSG